MTCEEFEELSGAFALDAVTPTERLAAEEHLATCARCTRLFKEIRGVVSLLPLSVPQVPPPPALKERILATIREEGNTVTGKPIQRIASVQPQQPQQPQQPLRARRPRWNVGILVAAAVLMFCLLGGSLAWSISLNHQVAELQQQVTQLTRHPATSSNVVSYSVKGTKVVQGATGLLYYYPQQHVTVLVMYGLPRPQGVHVYQGWLLHTSGKSITSVTSIGLLNSVNGTASVSFAGNVTGYDAAAVSIEPGPFATPNAPKGSVVALGSLKHAA